MVLATPARSNDHVALDNSQVTVMWGSQPHAPKCHACCLGFIGRAACGVKIARTRWHAPRDAEKPLSRPPGLITFRTVVRSTINAKMGLVLLLQEGRSLDNQPRGSLEMALNGLAGLKERWM